MTRRRLANWLALLTALVLLAAACGQKNGVHVSSGAGGGVDGEFAGSGEGFEEGGGEGAVDEAGNPIDGGGTGSDGGTDTGTDTGPGPRPTTPRQRSSTTSTTTGTPSGPGGPVWGKTIVIGVHAPITGAAPLPQSFARAATFFEGYINTVKGGIHGRTIKIEVVDDEYQPATAVQRCKELVQQKNAFLVVGGGGTDQIQACARYAAQVGVPYLSAGVTEIGLRSLKGYFAVSMSYKQQGAYLARFVKQAFPAKTSDPSKVWMVYSDTPNFADARDAFLAAFPGAQTRKLSRTPSGTELAQVARELCTPADKVRLAYPLMSPSQWLILLGNQPSDCPIQWSGVGLTMGLNAVTNTGCDTSRTQINGSTFFSPFPGTDRALDLDPDFKAEIQRRNETWDDIYVALWAVNKGLADALQKAGPNLTRSAFVRSTEASTINAGFGAVLNYAPNNHFGADTVHVLRADCGAGKKYVTHATNAKY